jgi:hypothetical protein
MMSYCDYSLMALKDRPSKASKNYKCCECEKPIIKGMNYWLFQGISDEDGTMETYKQHRECREACFLISKKDDCIPFGGLKEFLSDSCDSVDYIREAKKLYLDGIAASEIKTADLKYYNAKWELSTPRTNGG